MAAKLKSNDLIECPCTSSRNNLSIFPELTNILPEDYNYTVCNWKKEDDEIFESRFRVNVTSKDEALDWFEKFSISTSTAFNIEPMSLNCKEVYIVALRCRHNTKEEPRSFENEKVRVCKETFCPTRLVMILKLSGFSKEHEIPDVHLPEFPMTIIYHQHHNHPLESEAAVKMHFGKVHKHPNPYIRSVLKDLDKIYDMIQMKQLANEQPPLVSDIPGSDAAFTPKSFPDVIASIYPKPDEQDERATNKGFLLPREDDPSTYSIDPSSLGDHLASLPPMEPSSPKTSSESTPQSIFSNFNGVTYTEMKSRHLGISDLFKDLILRAKTEDKAKTQNE